MTTPTHISEEDYPGNFPAALDEFPLVENDKHYIDAWLLNSIFSSLLATEQYLIDWKDNIEAPAGYDILGEEGQLEISIPPARYPAYKTAMAWDSNLLEENIKSGETIFGVVGTLSAGGGGIEIAPPSLIVVPFLFPSALALDTAIPAISAPTTTVA